MKLSELKSDAGQAPKEINEYNTKVQLFSDDLSLIGGEKIIESRLLFHGAFSAKETEERAKSWSLYLQIVHLGDFWGGYQDPPRGRKRRVGFVGSGHEEPDWSLTPNDYVEETGKSGGAPINDNILAIRTGKSVVVLYRHWGSNESCQYPDSLRGVDNEPNILRTGGYNLYIFPVEQWDWITKEKNLKEWEEEFLRDDARAIGHWQGFGNI